MTTPSNGVTILPDTANLLAQPNPRDRLSGYAIGWGVWFAGFAVLEAVALHQDRKHHDRIKRTLSSNLRYIFATDSITGIPVDVKHGKLRRLALITFLAWFSEHLRRTKFV
jgi:hypothetical protein